MTLVQRPNTWVDVDTLGATLAYAPRVDPAPWTVSVDGRDPVLGSLEVVITNQTANPVAVESVSFTFEVGLDTAALTPTTEGIASEVSDPTSWQVSGPSEVLTRGKATYTLGPATGTSVTLAGGASVVVQLYRIQTGRSPGIANVAVKELTEGNPPAFVTFAITTFPDGFYFNGLIACVQRGSALVPAAQVPHESTVTLVWNASVSEVSAIDIYYSTPGQGQRHATPTTLGEWTSPPLAGDTSFVVVASAGGTGGARLTAALATGVSVQDPDLIATSLNAGDAVVTGRATVTGPLVANGVTATEITVDGNLRASGAIASASGTSSVAALQVGGAARAESVQAGNVDAGQLTAGPTTMTSTFTAKQGVVEILTGAFPLAPGTYVANTDGFLIGQVNWPNEVSPGCVGYAVAQCGYIVLYATGGNFGVYDKDWGRWKVSNGNAFTLPVAKGQQFQLWAWQVGGRLRQTDALIYFNWVPVGADPRAATYERMGDAPDTPPIVPEVTPTDPGAALEFIGLLEQIVEKPIDQQSKEALVDVLSRL